MFGEIVRACRRRLGLSQEDLAERARMSVRNVGNIETGRTAAPRPATVRLLADALELAGGERERFCQAAAGRPAVHLVGRAAAPPPAQLPADVYGFAGRDAHLAKLDTLVTTVMAGRRPAVVISAVAGAAGVGKTALAVYWAHRAAHRFPDGQLYVNLRGFDPTERPVAPSDAVRGFLDALGVPAERIPPSLDDRTALYRSALAGRRVLVLLDNARDAEQIRPLLPGAPGCLVLTTSRSRLTPLVATDGAVPVLLDVLTRDEAYALLTARLGADRLAAEPKATDEIITACAYLPLALTVVAARAAVRPRYPLAALAAELARARDRLDVLAAGDAATEVRAVFSWSFAALTEPAARLFRLFGLHPGEDISAAAAASLAGCGLAEARPLLAELLGASMLTETAPDRYTCHDLLRAYSTELVQRHEAAPERRAALGRLMDHYLRTTYAADRLLHPGRSAIPLPPAPDTRAGEPPADEESPRGVPERLADCGAALAWLRTERAALLAVLRQAAEAGFATEVWQLAWSADTYLDREGHWAELATVWHGALHAAERLGHAIARAHAHPGIAYAYGQLGRYAEAHEHHQRAIELYTQAGDVVGQVQAHTHLGLLWGRQHRYDLALIEAERALSLSEAHDDREERAKALNNLGWCQIMVGGYDQALRRCEQALALHQRSGDQHGEAVTWDSLGYAHHHLGHHDRAVECYERALTLLRGLGYRSAEAETLTHAGDTRLAAGDPRAARAVWQQALDIYTDLGHPDAEEVGRKLNQLDRRASARQL